MTEATPLLWAGIVAAMAAGLAGSLHCALMCGPLAAAARPHAAPAGRPLAAWHLGRLIAYALVGAALGLAGRGIASALASRVQPVLPWVMAVGLAASAFELGRRLPAVPALSAVARRIAGLGARLGATGRAAALGAATPLLPCGLLWGMFLAAVGAGTALGGSLVMVTFGVGSTPGLAAVQAGAAWSGRHPRVEVVLRRAIPLAAAALLVWRALMVPGAGAAPACH